MRDVSFTPCHGESGVLDMKDLSEYSFVDCVLLDFSMSKAEEHEDLQRPDDYKSNEVYFAQITPHDRGIAFELESDYLKISAVARNYQLFHLDE